MTGRDGDGGYILVTVLAVAVVLTGLLAAGSMVVRSALGAARVADAEVAAAGLLSSGVEIAAYQLAVLKIMPEQVDGRRIKLTGGIVTPHVTDEAGKVDLNASNPKLLAGVIEGTGMDAATAAAVVARIVELRGPPNGIIPDADGGTGGVPAAAMENTPRKRRGLQSVEDIRGIEGIRPEDMRLLRKWLTVYNTDGRLDIATAPPDLLAVVPGMTKLKLMQLMAAREAGTRDALLDAQSSLGGDLAGFIKALPGPAYTVRIDAEEAGGRRKSVEAVIAASKSPNQPYYVLDWRE